MNWLDMHMQDFFMIIILFLSFGWMIASAKLIPPPAGEAVGQAGYFVIIFVGLFGTDIYIRERVNKYPHLELTIRPNNNRVHLFLASGTTKVIGKNFFSATLTLAFPTIILDYGKVRTVIIHYHGDWSKRIHFTPGFAKYYGYYVSHPQTEMIEVYQVSNASTVIDHGEPTPVFFLHSASQDYYQKDSMSDKMLCLYSPENVPEREELQRTNAELRRSSSAWQQRALALEEINIQKTAETRGLLEAKGGMKDLAYEYMLTLYQAAGSIEAALKHIRGPKFGGFSKYVMYTVIFAIGIVYLWYNPQVAEGLQQWLMSPVNSLIFLVIMVVAAVVVWKWKGVGRLR